MRITVELVDGRTAVVELRMPCALSAWKTREVHRELKHDPALGPHAIVRGTGPDGEPVTILPSYTPDGDPSYVLPNASYRCIVCGLEGQRGNSMRMYCSDVCRMRHKRAEARSREEEEERAYRR